MSKYKVGDLIEDADGIFKITDVDSNNYHCEVVEWFSPIFGKPGDFYWWTHHVDSNVNLAIEYMKAKEFEQDLKDLINE